MCPCIYKTTLPWWNETGYIAIVQATDGLGGFGNQDNASSSAYSGPQYCEARVSFTLAHTYWTLESGMFRSFYTRTHTDLSDAVLVGWRASFGWGIVGGHPHVSDGAAPALTFSRAFRHSGSARDVVQETVSGSPDTAVVETCAPASDERAEAPTHVVVEFESGRLTNVLWRDCAVRVSRALSCDTPATHMHMHRCCSAETLTEIRGWMWVINEKP